MSSKKSRSYSALIYKHIQDAGGQVEGIISIADALCISYDYCYLALHDMADNGLVEIIRGRSKSKGTPLLVRLCAQPVTGVYAHE